MTQALDRVREAARRRKKGQFTALLHHLNPDTLRTAFYALRRKAAPGVDGVTWHDYEADLEPRVEALAERVHRGAYRPQPVAPDMPPAEAGGRQLGRSRSPPWKTRSSRAQPSWRSMLSTKATSAASRTGSDPGEGRFEGGKGELAGLRISPLSSTSATSFTWLVRVGGLERRSSCSR